MKTLVLPVRRKWFELIAAGKKQVEYRRVNEYWSRRLIGKRFSNIVVTLGYPPRHDLGRRLEFPWNGFNRDRLTCEEFGDQPVDVFAIRLVEHARQFRVKDEHAFECVYCGAEVRRERYENPETSTFLTRAGGWMRRHEDSCLGGGGGSKAAARRLPTEPLSHEK